jgi:protein phosphatase
VDDQHLGTALMCGKCGQTFTTRAAPAAERGGFAARLRGMFQSLLPSGKAEPPAAYSAPPDAEEEALLDLDGPGMKALAADAAAKDAAAGFRLEVAGATSVGRVRSRNEDSFLIEQLSWSNLDRRHDLALVVVADGMGGYAAGDQASGLLIQAAGAALTPLLLNRLKGQELSPAAAAENLAEAIRSANRAIYQRAQADPATRGMGATVAAALIWDGQVAIGHVGDCRVYHLGAAKLTQVTRDQTLVARLLEMGQLTPEEARTHPARNEVLQAVGRHPDVAPASYQAELKPGEWLVVACDGLHAHVDEAALEAAIWGAASAPQLAARLVEMADQGGGSDNCTVVAVRCF